jgi:hypothetical protein
MSLDDASAIAVAAAVVLAALIVAIVVAASAGACGGGPPGGRPGGGGGGAAAVHDVERALGDATLVTYEQARAAGKSGGRASAADEEEAPRCALCLSEFASSKAGEGDLVRVVLTCPLCRAEVWTTALPRPPRPECPPLPPRSGGATVGSR